MNRMNKRTLDAIRTAVLKFQSTMQDCLADYRSGIERFQTSHRKADFTPEAWDRLLTEEKARLAADVRTRTAAAQKQLSTAIGEQIPALRTELIEQLRTVPNSFFIDQLKNFQTFGLQPSELDCQAMLEVNAGNLTGLKMMNKMLENVKSPFRVTGSVSTDFEKDLTSLERFASRDQLFVPDTLLHDAVECFGGMDRGMGYRWDTISLLTASAFVKGFLEDIDQMEGRWSGEILPSLAQLETEYADGDTGTAEEQLESDRTEIADHAEIRVDGEAAAKAKAAELAQSERAYAAVMGHYRR